MKITDELIKSNRESLVKRFKELRHLLLLEVEKNNKNSGLVNFQLQQCIETFLMGYTLLKARKDLSYIINDDFSIDKFIENWLPTEFLIEHNRFVETLLNMPFTGDLFDMAHRVYLDNDFKEKPLKF